METLRITAAAVEVVADTLPDSEFLAVGVEMDRIIKRQEIPELELVAEVADMETSLVAVYLCPVERPHMAVREEHVNRTVPQAVLALASLSLPGNGGTQI